MSALTQALILLMISSLWSFLYRLADTNLLLIAWIACHSHSWSLTRCTRCPLPSLTTTLAASRKSRSRLGSLASSIGSRAMPSTALAARLATTLATRLAIALAIIVALSPFKKSLTIRVGLGQS